MRRFFHQATLMAQLVASLLVVTAAGRFTYSGFAMALDSTRGNIIDEPPARRAQRTKRQPAASASSSPAAEPSAAVDPVIRGTPVRVTLAVTAGPPRAEVYVNGRRVGRSPFLGDVSCKRGEPLRVEIVPDEGPLQRHVRACDRTTVRITSP